MLHLACILTTEKFYPGTVCSERQREKFYKLLLANEADCLRQSLNSYADVIVSIRYECVLWSAGAHE